MNLDTWSPNGDVGLDAMGGTVRGTVGQAEAALRGSQDAAPVALPASRDPDEAAIERYRIERQTVMHVGGRTRGDIDMRVDAVHRQADLAVVGERSLRKA
ncbi:hypothetical protein ABZ863_13240 [Saccharomonospora sp. NPDC046836]|uniref:hypothetical protein n=1 Tax=Saccharomonospora sp. NPDC046836 TaxID=3156921 RepID=UPI0033DFBD6F